ncbi:LysM peptidoglycan-binding domain-containing protein [Streptomyces sp. NPDC020801]|uniref:LysM peptidoglycan-binding domain-containing protein n=1 Tax=Streptomyces sp. NPDC020801 TaxID=3365093 RepID=UPI0037992747
MPTTRSRSTASAGPRPLRVLRALASALVLCALVAGLPWLLLAATTAVWDSGVDAFTHLLTRQDTGSAFMLALCLVGWAAWATFMLSLVLEIPAQLRGRSAPSLPGLGVSQRAAAILVGGIMLLFTTGTLASAAPASASVTASAGHVPGTPTQATVQTPAQQTPPAQQTTGTDQTQRTYTVRDTRPAESLWSIAEKLYGHGELYTKIADANEGHTMADGTIFHANAPIQPGWILRLPDEPTTGPTAQTTHTHPADSATTSYTVRTGDNLWDIAENQLGDGSKYTQIFEENRGAPQPGGTTLTDPDEIRPGLKLDIPHASAPSAPAPADPDHHGSKPPASGAGQHEHSSDHADHDGKTDTPAPASSAGTHTADPGPSAKPEHDRGATAPAVPAPSSTPTATPTAPSASPSASAQQQEPAPTASSSAPSKTTETPPSPTAEPADGGSDSPVIGVREGAGIGMLLAGCLLVTVSVKRLLQRRRRRPGETIAIADEPTSVEKALDASAEPASVDLLDGALRALARQAEQQGRPLPAIRGARVTAHTVELLLATDTGDQALAPFTAAGAGRWTLATRDFLDDETLPSLLAPCPGLVTLGTDLDGNHLLLNLPAVRVLLLDGDDDAVRDTARVIALEAATSTWSDHAEILTIGLGDELPALLPQGRLRVVPHLGAAQSDLGELLLEHHQRDEDEDMPPLPWLLICAAQARETDAHQLADALAMAHNVPVALVLPAKDANGAFPDAVRLTVGTDTPQHLDVLDSDLITQSLTEEEYREFLDVLHTAQEPARPAEGPWTLVPPVSLDKPETPMVAFAGPTAVPDTPFVALAGAGEARPADDSVRVLTAVPAQASDSDGVAEPAPSASDEPATAVTEEEPADAVDLHTPEIKVLGPVTVTGIEASGHGFKLALLAALLYFKPGTSSDAVREAMDPRKPWSKPTVQARISELRNRLGHDADSNLYLPRDRSGIYRLSPKVRCDWTTFQQRAERGLAKGPTAGIADLEAALGMVRGRPFADTEPMWAAARIQEMLVRITDVAHTLATWHRGAPRPDLDAARRAICIGLDVDDSAELLYQDWMLIEDQAGNRDGVTSAYNTLLAVNKGLAVSMEPETERIFDSIMSRSA